MLSPDRMPARLRVRLEFEDWLENQPRGKTYPWHNISECACAQFIAENYPPIPAPPPTAFLERVKRFFTPAASMHHPDAGLVWAQFNHVAGMQPWTFGALRDRLRKIP